MYKKLVMTLLLTATIGIAKENAFEPKPIPRKHVGEPRKVKYTGEVVLPTAVSLAVASYSFERMMNGLENRGEGKPKLFYNVVIDLTTRKIYFFTDEQETPFDEAVSTFRPRAIGISAITEDGFLQNRDGNSTCIAVGIIRDTNNPDGHFENEEAYAFFVNALTEICERFSIPRHRVFSFSSIAIKADGSYGRQCNERHKVINFEKLAKEHGFGLWQRKEDNTDIPFTTQEEAVRWATAAINLLGGVAPVTGDNSHPEALSSIKNFQEHHQCSAHPDGIVDITTLMAMNSLVKQKKEAEPKCKRMEPPTLDEYKKRKERESK